MLRPEHLYGLLIEFDVRIIRMKRRNERRGLRYRVKSPGGDWSEERTFFDAGIKNSYPTLLEYAPDRFLAVWDSGTEQLPRTSIRFGRLISK